MKTKPMKKFCKHDSITFAEIEQANAGVASRRVVERAVLANRIAHGLGCTRAGRDRAYKVKARAINQGLLKFPGQWGLSSVEENGRLLGLTWSRRHALHMPASQVLPAAREWLASELGRIRLLYGAQIDVAALNFQGSDDALLGVAA